MNKTTRSFIAEVVLAVFVLAAIVALGYIIPNIS
jgi:hypothetical protein